MNDSRITSYAVGELDAPDREIFEKELAASAELQGELKEIIALAEQLPVSFGPAEGLTDEQRESLRSRCADNRRTLRREKSARRRMAISGIAALAAGLTATAIVLSNHQESQSTLSKKKVASAPVPNAPVARAEPVKATEPAAARVLTTAPIAAAKPAPQAAPSAPATDRLLAEGQSFLDSQRFDLAYKRFELVLQSDAKNIAARRGLEKVDKEREQYASTAYNETRSRLLTKVEQGWELPVAKLSGGKDGETPPSGVVSGGSGLAAAGAAGEQAKVPILGDIPLSGRLAKSKSAAGSNGVASGSGQVTMPGNRSEAAGSTFALNAASAAPAEARLDALSATTASAPAQGQTIGGAYYAESSTVDKDVRLRERSKTIILESDLKQLPVASPGDESYAAKESNPFLDARANPLSTFSIDVDTASYANVRRFLTDGNLPPPDAVRIEELVNYFPYDYPQPEGDAPFSVNTEVSKTPWNSDTLLARVALKGRDIAEDKLPPSNLVFLIDVSGSMQPQNKLPLLKRSLLALVEKISPQDQVAIVTYAGDSGVALRSTSGEDKTRIQRAIKNLDAGGSTNGASGIELAYDIARKHFIKEGNNRIILCTDGDFNVGVTSMDDLTRLIEHERKSNIFLSVLGFGTGNLKDATMENLADKGNGNYAYIDTPSEGRKVLVDQMRANLFTIAKDVKIQVEFNPVTVAGYRLIGYENRMLAKEDFNNDKKDAGEIGAGHTVTALYEIVPAGQPFPSSVDPLKYQQPEKNADNEIKTRNPQPASTDLFTVKLRYKAPDGDKSKLIEKVVGPETHEFDKASQDFRFATAVAAFGMKLRGDTDDSELDWSEIQSIARGSLGEDPDAYRAEFLTLVQKAKQLSRDGE